MPDLSRDGFDTRPSCHAAPVSRSFAAAKLLLALGIVAALALAWVLSAVVIPSRAIAAQEDTSYRRQTVSLVRDLVGRDRFLAQADDGHLAGNQAPAPVTAADTTRITGLVPALPRLADVAAAQLIRLDQLTTLADERAASAERAIRRTGLNPRLVVARLTESQGGPLDSLATRDPRLTRLGASLARMSTLERALDTIPSHLPASLDYISSGFGYRSDPFTGEGALHAGLDFRGPIGAPIQAAADGTVTFAGVKGGYGNCIEITHAGGMMTRYGHMSAFKARQGQKVAAGDTIGAIGSTGRSTGPHLHFEVRVNGEAVNPRPYLTART
ncbi:MAG: M23 family metallopeptidase [Novosphingobium sp.]